MTNSDTKNMCIRKRPGLVVINFCLTIQWGKTGFRRYWVGNVLIGLLNYGG